MLLYHAFCGEKFLVATFLLLIVHTFHHIKLVLNAFQAISEGFNLKILSPFPQRPQLQTFYVTQSQTTKVSPPPPPRPTRAFLAPFGQSPGWIAPPRKAWLRACSLQDLTT